MEQAEVMEQELSQETVIDLSAIANTQAEPNSSGQSTNSESGKAFEDAFAEFVIASSSEWIDDEKERVKYQETMRRLIPSFIQLWNVSDALSAVGEMQRLPTGVRLLGCLATVGGMIYVLHPAGLKATMEKRRNNQQKHREEVSEPWIES